MSLYSPSESFGDRIRLVRCPDCYLVVATMDNASFYWCSYCNTEHEAEKTSRNFPQRVNNIGVGGGGGGGGGGNSGSGGESPKNRDDDGSGRRDRGGDGSGGGGRNSKICFKQKGGYDNRTGKRPANAKDYPVGQLESNDNNSAWISEINQVLDESGGYKSNASKPVDDIGRSRDGGGGPNNRDDDSSGCRNREGNGSGVGGRNSNICFKEKGGYDNRNCKHPAIDKDYPDGGLRRVQVIN